MRESLLEYFRQPVLTLNTYFLDYSVVHRISTLIKTQPDAPQRLQRQWFLKDNELICRVNYLDGCVHGIVELWYGHGPFHYRQRLYVRQYYRIGQKHGMYQCWNCKGRLLEQKCYANGKLHGAHENWNIGGQLISKQHYKNGQKHGGQLDIQR